MRPEGQLVCVGVGMTLGAHISARCRDCIEASDVVFMLVSDGLVEEWVSGMNPDVRSLQPFYSEGKSRRETYREMTAVMLEEVRAGKRVCGVFYGHPGVFAFVPHETIRQARDEGFHAKMEPGISAEDCLYADLGIDPGRYGCQHYEASQFMFYKRNIDPSAYLVLWQVGIAGDRTLSRWETGAEYRSILLELLYQQYPRNHEVILYEAVTLPIQKPRTELIRLSELQTAELSLETTMVVPPCQSMVSNESVMQRINALDNETNGKSLNASEEAI